MEVHMAADNEVDKMANMAADKKMADMCTIVQTCQCLKKNDFSAFDVINELIRSHLTPYMS